VFAWVVNGPEVRLWNAATGQPRTPLQGKAHEHFQSVLFSPDGKTVAAVGEQYRVHVWDVATAKLLPQILEPSNENDRMVGSDVAYSADGRLLAAELVGRIDVRELASGQRVCLFDLGDEIRPEQIYALAFSPDGRTLASGGGGSCSILLWDATGGASAAPAHQVVRNADDIAPLWAQLRGPAQEAYRALWRLVEAGPVTVEFLSQYLRPVKQPSPDHLAKLFAALDHDSFAERERASRDLEALGDSTRPAIRRALEKPCSLELQKRLQNLLRNLEPTSPARLREVRAVAVLEHIATPPARDLLKTLAQGNDEARLTQEAKAALGRLPH
jgi:hypothetical protein